MYHILGEIQVLPGKCASHIVIVLVSAVGKLLKLRDNELIASLAVSKRAHLIVDLRTAVQAQHHVSHLPVAELHDLVV